MNTAGFKAGPGESMLWKSGVAGVLLWLCAMVPGWAQDRPTMGPSPAWVVGEELVARAGPAADGDDLRYEVVSDQVDLTADKPVWHRHIRYLIVRERGLSDAGSISIGYQPDYQSLVLNQLDVVREGQRIDMRERAHYARLRREEDLAAGLLDGELTLNVTVPDLRVGDRVDYSFSVVGDNPIFGNAYYETYSARYGVPLAFRRVRVRTPAARPLFSRVTASGFDVSRVQAGGMATLDITGRNLPAVRAPDETPEGFDSFGRISLSTVKDWAGVVDWAVPLYPRAFSDQAVAREVARQLALDPSQPEGALLRAVAFVQGQVRYTGLDMGDNSHKPHPPEDTLRDRYGDCKDKATLLIALLQLAGVRAEPVLVNTRPGYDLQAALPGANVFDHVVVRAHLPTGEVWIDATRDREEGPLAERRALPFQYGLPLVAGATGLVGIPYPAPSRPQVEVAERMTIGRDGDRYTTGFDVVTTYRQGQGDDVLAAFRNDGAAEQGRRYLRYMRGFYEGIQAKGDPRADEASEGGLTTHEAYTLGWDQADGDMVDVWLFQFNDWMKEISTDARTTPLALQGPRFARQRVEVQVQGPLDVPDRRQEISNPWFRFVRTEHVQGQALVITGEWSRLATQVPASGIAQAASDMEKARALLVFTLDMDSGASLGKAGWRDWAWPVAGVLLAIVLVLVCFPMRRGVTPMAMLFAPKAAAPRLQGHAWAMRVAWAVYFAVTYVDLLAQHLEPGSKIPAQFVALGLIFGAMIGGWLRAALSAGFLRLSLSWLKCRAARFDALLAALVAAAFPMLPFTLGALAALQGHVSWLHEDFPSESAHLPGIMVAGVLLVIGYGWSFVASVCAVAGVASISRRRALVGFLIPAAVVLVLVGVVAGIVRLAR
ncbi:DUF3857 domain-containing protein [Pseudoxanthomonas sp.]|uniref:DUF3857 domain-containing protein n=1 Tax=Pseudoxanthomonas sp. TaxID=1871049 RepID=UPI00261E6CAE|nr:DUF3857 domain-containing protein [Pseudoxanthomonas sp.]WDS36698.1 MAG: DUF3857 domain-containing protein [Pseudoxanthomonas sp.]